MKEGFKKNGGVNEVSTKPKPNITPPAQNFQSVQRYDMWAAPSNPYYIKWFLDSIKKGKQIKDKPLVEAIYPIVDTKTCGPINGFPRADQFFCVCFNEKDQRRLWHILNGIKES